MPKLADELHINLQRCENQAGDVVSGRVIERRLDAARLKRSIIYL
jgi:hypothetical protein